MKKLTFIFCLFTSFSLIADTQLVQNPDSSSHNNNIHKNDIIHKVCLFHNKIYQVIPFAKGQCDFDVPGNFHPPHNGIGLPGDPKCFSEFIRVKHKHR